MSKAKGMDAAVVAVSATIHLGIVAKAHVTDCRLVIEVTSGTSRIGNTGQESQSQFGLVLGIGGYCEDHDLQLCVAVGQDVAIHRDRPDCRVFDDLVVFSMCADRCAGRLGHPFEQIGGGTNRGAITTTTR